MKGKVRNLITLGTPNLGIVEAGPEFSFPPFTRDQINEIGRNFSKFTLAQLIAAPAGYFRDNRNPTTFQNYIKYSWHLAKLNNENDPTSKAALARKQKVTSLNKWLAVYFQRDGIVAPRESAVFGEYQMPWTVGGPRKVVQMQDTQMYKEDWLGLKTLYEAGKFIHGAIDNSHVTFSD